MDDCIGDRTDGAMNGRLRRATIFSFSRSCDLRLFLCGDIPAAAMRPFILVIAWVCSVLTFVRAIPLPTAESNQELDMLQIPLPNGKYLITKNVGLWICVSLRKHS
uniref:Uncharacterized protein n=1 Tax=Glossina austeni TaxID=7395 RepID=A0A1A9UEF4_GLOAU